MATDPSNMTTLQDVINVLSVLFFNMNEVERVFYDVFLNPNPMDVPVQRYDANGQLETITIPNRAKMSISILTGVGNPNGVEPGNVGAFYLDLDPESCDLYFKGVGAEKSGWVKIWSNGNFQKDVDYLPPNGEAPNLTKLNADNITLGTLQPAYGGTGANSLNGMVKGNGATLPFTEAQDGEDYMGPASMTGMIMYYPTSNIPVGWLVCDGSEYSRTEYPLLFDVIGTLYGAGDGTTTFNVPNLMNHFVRCWDGESEFNTVQEPQVGGHTHSLEGINTGIENQTHTHTRGTMDITGYIDKIDDYMSCSGAFQMTNPGSGWNPDGGSGSDRRRAEFRASREWTGSTSAESQSHTHPLSGSTASNAEGAENRVLNKMLVPVICYGRRRRPQTLGTRSVTSVEETVTETEEN